MSQTLSEKQILYFKGKNKFYFDFYTGGLAGTLEEIWIACSIQVILPLTKLIIWQIFSSKQCNQQIFILLFRVLEHQQQCFQQKKHQKDNFQLKQTQMQTLINSILVIFQLGELPGFLESQFLIPQINLQYTIEVIKNDGFLAFYKGFGVSMLGAFVYRAIYFGGYDLGKAIIWGDDDMKSNISLPHNSITASVAVFLGKSLEQPFLAIKTEMNNKRNVFQSQKAWKCLIRILRQKGVNSLFVYNDIFLSYNADLFALIFYDRFQKQWMYKKQKKMN